ncbi:MAG: DUF6272 family protein [Flavobacteriales bacterium]
MSTTFSYTGLVNDNLRVQMQDFLHTVVTSCYANTTNPKRLLVYSLELLDNAQRYSVGDITFTWTFDGNKMRLLLKNKANRDDAKRLEQMVANINTMTREQISSTYKAQLNNNEFGEKGGAGLGYLLMAKNGIDKVTITISDPENNIVNCTNEIEIAV